MTPKATKSGAEALAALGLIVNVLALVDFSRDVFEQAGDLGGKVKDVPKASRDLKVVLRLTSDTSEKAKARANAGELDEVTCKAITPFCKAARPNWKKAFFEKVIS